MATLNLDKVAEYFHETGDAFAGQLVRLSHNLERHANGDAPLDPGTGIGGAAYSEEEYKEQKSKSTSGSDS